MQELKKTRNKKVTLGVKLIGVQERNKVLVQIKPEYYDSIQEMIWHDTVGTLSLEYTSVTIIEGEDT